MFCSDLWGVIAAVCLFTVSGRAAVLDQCFSHGCWTSTRTSLSVKAPLDSTGSVQQCDREPANTTPGPWKRRSWMEFSHCSSDYLHPCFPCYLLLFIGVFSPSCTFLLNKSILITNLQLEAGQRSLWLLKQTKIENAGNTEFKKEKKIQQAESRRTKRLVVHSVQGKKRNKHLLPPVYSCFKKLADRQDKLVCATEKEKEKRGIPREKKGKWRRKQTEKERTLKISVQLQDKASHSSTVSWKTLKRAEWKWIKTKNTRTATRRMLQHKGFQWRGQHTQRHRETETEIKWQENRWKNKEIKKKLE